MKLDTISIAAGNDLDTQISLLDSAGNPVTTFITADTLTAVVWSGGSSLPVFNPTATWISAPLGTIKLTIAGSSTSNITPEKYRMRVNIVTTDVPARTITAWDGYLAITPSPGTTTSPSVYCTYQDLLDYAPWVEDELADKDSSGFVRQCHQARKWLETVIQRHFRWQTGTWGQDTYGFATSLFPSGYSYGHSPVLQGWLDSGKLIANDQVVEICAKRALGLILQASQAPGKDNPYADLGNKFLRESDSLVRGYVAEMDINGDGITDFTVHCGNISVRS